MKFSYQWLQKYIDLKLPYDKLADELTFSGIEVEAIHYQRYFDYIKNVKAAEILSQEKHPQADKLWICEVYDGTETKKVVCGAPNCKKGVRSAYIPAGETLSAQLIKKVYIKGVESDGMLCSEKDINLSDNHEGIIELPSEVKPGTPLIDIYGSENVIYEVEITPNRPDLLGILGISRDIAAILNLPLSYPSIKRFDNLAEDKPLVENKEPDLCTRYLAKKIKNVTITESPLWLKKILLCNDIKPVNNVVDITNYVMMEFGHPLHAFDYELLNEGRIVVRRAGNGEKISALDNRTHKLTESDLVIADSSNPVAIAGIIGNVDSSITKETKNIILEAANFNYVSIRNTANRLKINTDSAYRFQRNLSDETVSDISDRAAELILDLCGGELESYCDIYPSPVQEQRVRLRPSKANKLLNISLSTAEMVKYLERLELKAEKIESKSNNAAGKENLSSEEEFVEFSIPHFRKDLSREIDLIEEIIKEGLPATATNTVTDPNQLCQEINMIREKGYAISNSEHVDGVTAISAPIKKGNGSVIASLSVVGPSFRIQESDETKYLNYLLETVAEVSKHLGYQAV